MWRSIVAVCVAVAVAAMVTYGAFAALGSECASDGFWPGVFGRTNLGATKPGETRAGAPTPSASFDLQISDQDKMQGKLYVEPWRGSRTEWLHKFVCDVRAGELVIAVFSLFLTVFAGLLLGILSRFWVTMRDATRTQTRNTEAIERAYLSAVPAGVDPFDASAYAEGNVAIRNTGRLPACKVQWFIDAAVSSDAKRNHFPVGALSGSSVIHAGAEMMQQGRVAVSPQEFQNFRHGGLWIYVWGTIRYDDGFGNERHTDFCHRYEARGFSSGDPTVSAQQALQLGRGAVSATGAVYHQNGNDAG